MPTYANINELKNAVNNTIYNNDLNTVEANHIRDRIKDVADFLYAAIPAPNPSDFLEAFVSQQYGDDTTGKLGDRVKPFATIKGANDALIAQGHGSDFCNIHILNGFFTTSSMSESPFVNDFNYIFYPGFTGIYQNLNNIVLNADGFGGNVLGYGNFSNGCSDDTPMFQNLYNSKIQFTRILMHTAVGHVVRNTSVPNDETVVVFEGMRTQGSNSYIGGGLSYEGTYNFNGKGVIQLPHSSGYLSSIGSASEYYYTIKNAFIINGNNTYSSLFLPSSTPLYVLKLEDCSILTTYEGAGGTVGPLSNLNANTVLVLDRVNIFDTCAGVNTIVTAGRLSARNVMTNKAAFDTTSAINFTNSGVTYGVATSDLKYYL